MKQVTIQYGSTIPLVIDAGEYIKLKTSSLCAGTVAIPGEAVADTLVASSEYAYGKYTGKREVIVNLTAGSADVIIDSGSPPVEFNTPSNLLGATSSAALAASGYFRGAFPFTANYTPGVDTAMASPPTKTSSGTKTLSGVFYRWDSPQVGNNQYLLMSGAPPYAIYSQVVDNGSGGRAPGGGMAAWIDTDSANVEIQLLDFQPGQYLILVDGQHVSLTPTVTGSSFADIFVKLAFGSRKMRRIRVEYISCLFAGFVVDTNATALYQPKTRRLHVVGDSYVQGQLGGNISNTSKCFAHQFTRALGYDNVWPNGNGGTGYLQDVAGQSRPNLLNRMDTDLIPFIQDGDVVLNLCGYNDRAFSNTAVSAAITQFVQRVKAIGKNVTVVIATQFSPRPDGPPVAAVPGADAAFMAAALSAGAFTFDQSDALTGSGYNGSGTGNSAYYIGADGLHPSEEGNTYLSSVLVKKLKACLSGW